VTEWTLFCSRISPRLKYFVKWSNSWASK
jgi:hypothetical protein